MKYFIRQKQGGDETGKRTKAYENPKAEPTAETRALAKANAKAKWTPEPLRVGDRTGGDWGVSNRIGSQSQMRRDDGGRCTGRFSGNDSGRKHYRTRWQVAAHPNSRNLWRKRQRFEVSVKLRITSMKQKIYKINEQGSDGEEVSHEQQHRTDIESKRPCETTGGQQTTQWIQDTEEQRVHDTGFEMVTTKQDGTSTFPESPAEGASKKSQTTRRTESEAQRATNELSRVAEVTKMERSKLKQ